MAKAHCSVFLSEYSFPIDIVMKVDNLLAIVWGFSVVPNGCRRTYFVAVNDRLIDTQDLKSHGVDQKFDLDKGYVVGSLTMDTLADYLPLEGPLQQRRTGVAYLSDLLVREQFRRKGIAKELIVKAEAYSKSWGCRAIALHCDLNNIGAIELYRAHGFKSIKVPEGAKWPQPKTSNNIKSNFMMKLLYTQKS
ncbi:GCN5-related N-acetyltransferase 4, chloroplastic-like [Daucus carota subsp. sativus]|nr:PREDICTED: uncharacterized protein LOC108209713 [Daucus carota subsp. sativus]XP_017236263.1 PREDICTED: uncharacterized protein LOC108209713 [Daucus carota subsp. sativus]